MQLCDCSWAFDSGIEQFSSRNKGGMVVEAASESTRMSANEIGRIVVDCAVQLHKELGPGLLESVYEVILAHELIHYGLIVKRQVPIPTHFHGIEFEEGFRADMVIEGRVLLELKSVDKAKNVHKKQVLTYLRLTGIGLGYLLNFGEELMKNGIFRILNGTIE